jgi:hypothetical protein
MTHTGVGTTQKYREKVIKQGKVPVCCANTHRVRTVGTWGGQAPPHCAWSSAPKMVLELISNWGCGPLWEDVNTGEPDTCSRLRDQSYDPILSGVVGATCSCRIVAHGMKASRKHASQFLQSDRPYLPQLSTASHFHLAGIE